LRGVAGIGQESRRIRMSQVGIAGTIQEFMFPYCCIYLRKLFY